MNVRFTTILMALLLGALPTWLVAQYNSKGTFHASIGTAIGAHGIAYDETIKLNVFGVPFEYSQSSTGGAATSERAECQTAQCFKTSRRKVGDADGRVIAECIRMIGLHHAAGD